MIRNIVEAAAVRDIADASVYEGKIYNTSYAMIPNTMEYPRRNFGYLKIKKFKWDIPCQL